MDADIFSLLYEAHTAADHMADADTLDGMLRCASDAHRYLSTARAEAGTSIHDEVAYWRALAALDRGMARLRTWVCRPID